MEAYQSKPWKWTGAAGRLAMKARMTTSAAVGVSRVEKEGTVVEPLLA